MNKFLEVNGTNYFDYDDDNDQINLNLKEENNKLTFPHEIKDFVAKK